MCFAWKNCRFAWRQPQPAVHCLSSKRVPPRRTPMTPRRLCFSVPNWSIPKRPHGKNLQIYSLCPAAADEGQHPDAAKGGLGGLHDCKAEGQCKLCRGEGSVSFHFRYWWSSKEHARSDRKNRHVLRIILRSGSPPSLTSDTTSTPQAREEAVSDCWLLVSGSRAPEAASDRQAATGCGRQTV